MQDVSVLNEIGFTKPETKPDTLMSANEARAVAEVQASYVIAKKFPRNKYESLEKIIETCKRPFLAEKALYAYPKGGQLVTGPSIRLAEAIAQAWTNISFGFNEISQQNGVSIIEAYAVDKENNSDKRTTFQVPHVRDTKQGRKRLTDARDIYELCANQASRRIRNCILALIDGDVVEAAVDQVKKTLEGGVEDVSAAIKKMVAAFLEVGVKVEHLEKRLGHKLDATIPSEIVKLKAIYRSIRDGFAPREEFFEIGEASPSAEAKEEVEQLLSNKKQKEPNTNVEDK